MYLTGKYVPVSILIGSLLVSGGFAIYYTKTIDPKDMLIRKLSYSMPITFILFSPIILMENHGELTPFLISTYMGWLGCIICMLIVIYGMIGILIQE
jgi:hypothetical protein